MPDAFVPFFSQPPKGQSSGAGAKDAFVAAVATVPSAQNPGAGQPAAQHRPVINVKRDGDRVRTIHIECCCGEIIDLDCIY